MRIPAPLAWLILVSGFLTATLLRQFHDRTPEAPLVTPVVGSLLFAAIFFLLLVTAWERQRGAVAGRGVRLGSLTPILLMLLIEKWLSLAVYPLVFAWIAPAAQEAQALDAQFRAFAGLLLILICLLIAQFSAPTASKTWRRARPARWPTAMLATLVVVASCYLLLGGLSWLLGGSLQLRLPASGTFLVWTLGGQALLAFAEELYYRGLLMSEMERLAPRLGARNPAARRWVALLFSAALFGGEHLTLGPPWDQSARQLVFAVALGVLLGVLVMVSANLHFSAGLHAWINWLLLGAAPSFADLSGRPALPSGTYIGLALILAFVLAFVVQRLRRKHTFQHAHLLGH